LIVHLVFDNQYLPLVILLSNKINLFIFIYIYLYLFIFITH